MEKICSICYLSAFTHESAGGTNFLVLVCSGFLGTMVRIILLIFWLVLPHLLDLRFYGQMQLKFWFLRFGLERNQGVFHDNSMDWTESISIRFLASF